MQVKCDECKAEYFPEKPWQRFCRSKCRDTFNNREKRRAKVEAAEERRADRMNGVSAGGPKIDLVALGVKPAAKPFVVKRWAR